MLHISSVHLTILHYTSKYFRKQYNEIKFVCRLDEYNVDSHPNEMRPVHVIVNVHLVKGEFEIYMKYTCRTHMYRSCILCHPIRKCCFVVYGKFKVNRNCYYEVFVQAIIFPRFRIAFAISHTIPSYCREYVPTLHDIVATSL